MRVSIHFEILSNRALKVQILQNLSKMRPQCPRIATFISQLTESERHQDKNISHGWRYL